MGHCFLRRGLRILLPVIFFALFWLVFGLRTISLCNLCLVGNICNGSLSLLSVGANARDGDGDGEMFVGEVGLSMVEDVLYCLSAALTRLSNEDIGGKAKLLLCDGVVALVFVCCCCCCKFVLLNFFNRLNFSIDEGS